MLVESLTSPDTAASVVATRDSVANQLNILTHLGAGAITPRHFIDALAGIDAVLVAEGYKEDKTPEILSEDKRLSAFYANVEEFGLEHAGLVIVNKRTPAGIIVLFYGDAYRMNEEAVVFRLPEPSGRNLAPFEAKEIAYSLQGAFKNTAPIK